MNFVKKNLKWILGIIVGVVIASGISVYATGQYLASQVEYNKNGQAKVSDALDDLYSKVPSGTKTITEKGNQIDVSKYQYADTTGLYTLSEVQSGQGTHWNSGNFTSVTGINTINVGFVPNKIVIYRSRDDRTLMYNASESTTTTRRYQGETFSNTDTIEANRTTLGFESINSNTRVWIANAGDTWYWFATE